MSDSTKSSRVIARDGFMITQRGHTPHKVQGGFTPQASTGAKPPTGGSGAKPPKK